MKIINRRTALAAVAATLLPVGSIRAQSPVFPSRTVAIVVGFPAGGATDVTARVAQPHLQKAWGQTVIVENVSGAGGSIGVQKMLNATQEGHVLFLGTASDTVLAPLAIQSARYRTENLRLLGYMGQAEFAIVARPGLALNTLDDLVAYMRTPSSKELSYASFGNGSIYHLIGEDLKSRTGGQLLHVPFQGMGPTVTNLIGNQVDLGFLPIAGQTVGLINSGRVKAIAVTGARRNPQLPNVASVDESQHMKGFHHTVWLGLFGPSSLPADAAARVNAAVNEAIRSPEYLKFSAENGTGVPDPGLTLQQTTKFYVDETEKLRLLAKSIKLEAK
ncbi:MAG: tripartite tricarboxylate transporter substrate binding protein [Polaromonas sp.]|uniref:tripartite tricarboxylate transporter substrate binding protein n=1 Tax=Polaromonas sp. TaxID=1869339 RepID=UPI0024899E0C|nr:tripartite tricarboxylate transporter substrate binding protein [Polaromonas sp.]MDI1269414.1 tripartite tricarboxylate transporter substrate binding protein [Polaromonas sp.]